MGKQLYDFEQRQLEGDIKIQMKIAATSKNI